MGIDFGLEIRKRGIITRMSRDVFWKLEKIIKGAANHRRVEILYFLAKNPDLSLFDITKETRVNFRTVSEHLRRLVISGLVIKINDGNIVRHKLTKLGETILKFLRALE